MSEANNEREDDRVKVDAFVKVSGRGDREYVFRTRDLSANGLFLYTRVTHIYPIQVGSELSLEVYDFDQAIECTVIVARVVEPSSDESESFPTGFGVRIAKISDADAGRLQSLIARLQKGVAPY